MTDEDAVVTQPDDLVALRRSLITKVKSNNGKSKTVRRKQMVPKQEWLNEISAEWAEALQFVEGILHMVNVFLYEHDFTYIASDANKTRRLYPTLHAVYTDNFCRGGRLYTARGGHQSLSKRERATIRIDGQPTMELDFGGLHIRMLYHLAGKEYPLNSDPYESVIQTMGMESEAILKGKRGRAIRNDLKVMLLALINGTARSEKEAANHANRRLFRIWHDEKDSGKREEVKKSCEKRLKRWNTAGLTVTAVVQAFYKSHVSIAHYFSTGIGLRLQNLDAAIASCVLLAMALDHPEYVPVLPVHDSFITLRENETVLRATMKRAYQHVMRAATGRQDRLSIPVS